MRLYKCFIFFKWCIFSQTFLFLVADFLLTGIIRIDIFSKLNSNKSLSTHNNAEQITILRLIHLTCIYAKRIKIHLTFYYFLTFIVISFPLHILSFIYFNLVTFSLVWYSKPYFCTFLIYATLSKLFLFILWKQKKKYAVVQNISLKNPNGILIIN